MIEIPLRFLIIYIVSVFAFVLLMVTSKDRPKDTGEWIVGVVICLSTPIICMALGGLIFYLATHLKITN